MPPREPSAAAAWAQELAQRLSVQRDRLRKLTEAQRTKAGQWQHTLHSQVASIEQALQAVAGEGQQCNAELERKLALLTAEQAQAQSHDADLVQHRDELAALRRNWEISQQEQLAQQQLLFDEVTRSLLLLQQREAAQTEQLAELAAAQAETALRQRACDDAERIAGEHAADAAARLQEWEASLEQRAAQLLVAEQASDERNGALRAAEAVMAAQTTAIEFRQHELKLLEQRTRSQRSAAVQELRARRKELLAEVERRRLESVNILASDESTLALQLSESRREYSELQASDDKHTQHQAALEQQLEQARRELQLLQQQLRQAGARLAAPAGSSETDDLRKRLDMALADLRDLKSKNSELSAQLAKGTLTGPPVVASGGDDNWETRKQRMIAQLESDFDEHDPQQKAGKLTVQEAIRHTEAVIAEKDQEIRELQQLLSQQSGNIGGVAIGAAAIAEMLDTDELVRQERESLRELQAKLREQLMQAEIDVSVERAKVARERTLLDEKMRLFEQQQQHPQPPSAADPNAKQGGNRGRWFQRLGLRDDEQK